MGHFAHPGLLKGIIPPQIGKPEDFVKETNSPS